MIPSDTFTISYTHTYIHTHTHSASQAVKQLSDMIEGLDSMMDNIKARSPTIAKKPSPDKPDDTSQTGLTAQLATTGKASATDDASIPTPPVDDLVAQLEGKTHTTLTSSPGCSHALCTLLLEGLVYCVT